MDRSLAGAKVDHIRKEQGSAHPESNAFLQRIVFEGSHVATAFYP
jgi:hypothetical protein